MEQAEELALAVDTDYQALSNREETDLESLMSQCETAISNAEAFAEQLQSELSVLDGVSVSKQITCISVSWTILKILLTCITGMEVFRF